MKWKFCSQMMAALAILTMGLALVPNVCAAAGNKAAKGNKGTLTVLYGFDSQSGEYPQGVMAQGRDGNFYSTTPYGGNSNDGTIFKITPQGDLTVLYELDSYNGSSGLTLGTDGNFYGATVYGGNDFGTVFKVTPNGILTTLYSMTGQNEDADPLAPPIQAADGNLYGTATGTNNDNGGEVYKMTPSGGKVALFHLNHRQGVAPADPLVLGMDGNLYGTASGGGDNGCGPPGCGVIFKITPKGHITVLHDFSGDGFSPEAPLVQGSDGNFYGSAPYGGADAYGTLYKISPSGKFTLLHIFTGAGDGRFPFGGLLLATDGNFYGTTEQGGSFKAGVIYKVTPEGKFSVVYDFDGTTSAYPLASLVQHTNGKLYGATYGYTLNYGTFFRFDLGLGPFVSLVSTSGKVGKSVGILGQGFAGTTNVAFNGASAKFKVVSDTYLMATVPAGATTGFVTVAAPGGKLKSNKEFRVSH